MSASDAITRRAFAGGALALALGGKGLAQGFAGLGENAEGFAAVTPGKPFAFPADHGPHPEFRIEWWYVTANLSDAGGAAYGAQWTLFRQAMKPGGPSEGWANQQLWMGHAAVTSASTHRFSETFARGGVGQAGVEAAPFHAWIDAWEIRGLDGFDAQCVAPLELKASAADFQHHAPPRSRPRIGAARRPRLQPQIGSRTGLLLLQPAVLPGYRPHRDRRQAGRRHGCGVDGSRMEQPAIGGGSNRLGLVLSAFARRREADAVPAAPEGRPRESFSATGSRRTAARPRSQPPATASRHPQPPRSPTASCRHHGASPCPRAASPSKPRRSIREAGWGTSFPYWEGPIRFSGSHAGLGYLEMTGY